MLGFLTDELVWAIGREREDEARRVLPHTERRGDPERTTHENERRFAWGSWVAWALRSNAPKPSCR